ncbi:MAG: rod shape-determining protein MreD [Chlamydiota bacterium]
MSFSKNRGVWPPFILCLSFLLSFPIVFPTLKLTFFAPFIVMLYYQQPKQACLWVSFWCGLIIDILSSSSIMGMHVLNYCLTTAILYEKRRAFFEDSIISLPIMTMIFSMLSSILQASLLKFFGASLPLSWHWVFTDLVVMSGVDGLYAFILFTIPTLFRIHRGYRKKPNLLKRPK